MRLLERQLAMIESPKNELVVFYGDMYRAINYGSDVSTLVEDFLQFMDDGTISDKYPSDMTLHKMDYVGGRLYSIKVIFEVIFDKLELEDSLFKQFIEQVSPRMDLDSQFSDFKPVPIEDGDLDSYYALGDSQKGTSMESNNSDD